MLTYLSSRKPFHVCIAWCKGCIEGLGEFETVMQTRDKVEGLHNCQAPTYAYETKPDHNSLRTMCPTLFNELHLLGLLRDKCFLLKAKDNTKPSVTTADCLWEWSHTVIPLKMKVPLDVVSKSNTTLLKSFSLVQAWMICGGMVGCGICSVDSCTLELNPIPLWYWVPSLTSSCLTFVALLLCLSLLFLLNPLVVSTTLSLSIFLSTLLPYSWL